MYASRFQHTTECIKQREAYMRLPKHFLEKQPIGAYKAIRRALKSDLGSYKALHRV